MFYPYVRPKFNCLIQNDTRVVIHGLASEKGQTLNGKKGIAIKVAEYNNEDIASTRWAVQVIDDDDHDDDTEKKREEASEKKEVNNENTNNSNEDEDRSNNNKKYSGTTIDDEETTISDLEKKSSTLSVSEDKIEEDNEEENKKKEKPTATAIPLLHSRKGNTFKIKLRNLYYDVLSSVNGNITIVESSSQRGLRSVRGNINVQAGTVLGGPALCVYMDHNHQLDSLDVSGLVTEFECMGLDPKMIEEWFKTKANNTNANANANANANKK